MRTLFANLAILSGLALCLLAGITGAQQLPPGYCRSTDVPRAESQGPAIVPCVPDLEQQRQAETADQAHEKAARQARAEFDRRIEAFRVDWNALMASLREGKANLKQFRQAAKRWDDLYRSEGWLK
jgi:hypothetical protein